MHSYQRPIMFWIVRLLECPEDVSARRAKGGRTHSTDAGACIEEIHVATTRGRRVMRSWSAACLTVGSSSRSRTAGRPTTNVLGKMLQEDLGAATKCVRALGGSSWSGAMSGPQAAYPSESSVYLPQVRSGCAHPPVGDAKAMLRRYPYDGVLDDACKSSTLSQTAGETILAREAARARGATCG